MLQPVSQFAAAIGVCVAVFYYVMTLRVQQANMKATLQAREAQLFNSLYQRFSTADYTKQYLTCMLMKWDSYEDWIKKYPDDCYEALQFYSLCNWYKTMNLLIKEGYVSADAMGRLIAFDFIGFWEKFKPIVEGMRRNVGETALLDMDELYRTLKESAKHIIYRQDGFERHFTGLSKK